MNPLLSSPWRALTALTAVLAVAAGIGAAAVSAASAAPSTGSAESAASHATALPRGGPVPKGFTPVSSTMSRGVTYLLGVAPCSTAICTSVVRYDGKGWRGIPAPVAPLETTEPSTKATTVRDLRFATPSDGWAFGGALWSTHNGGKTWKHINAGAPVWDLATDGRTTYAIVGSCSSSGQCHLRLRSAPAGADSWRDVPGVTATGTTARISLGSGTAAVSLGNDSLFVRRGTQWKHATNPCTDRAPVVASSASSARIFALCGEGAMGSLYLTTSYSDDQGRHWTTRAGGASRLQLANGPFVSVTAASSSLLYAASGSPELGGVVNVSRDGGKSWQLASGRNGLPTLDQGVGGWRYVGASSGTRIVALLASPRRTYWVTYDGGRHWAQVTFAKA